MLEWQPALIEGHGVGGMLMLKEKEKVTQSKFLPKYFFCWSGSHEGHGVGGMLVLEE